MGMVGSYECLSRVRPKREPTTMTYIIERLLGLLKCQVTGRINLSNAEEVQEGGM